MDNFSKKTRDWLKSVIKQREYLLRIGESKVPEISARMAVEELNRYLEAYNYSDVNMAKFLLRNKEKVRAILPGNGASTHMKRRNEFRDLLMGARGLVVEPLKIEFHE